MYDMRGWAGSEAGGGCEKKSTHSSAKAPSLASIHQVSLDRSPRRQSAGPAVNGNAARGPPASIPDAARGPRASISEQRLPKHARSGSGARGDRGAVLGALAQGWP